jgi:nucleotide-binding universal stress UspA family protein
MMIKTILVPLDGSKASTETLDTAFVVADRFGAHIDALHVLPKPTDVAPFMFDRLSAKMKDTFEAEIAEDAREKAAAIRMEFEERCEHHNVSITDKPTAKKGVTAAWREAFGRAGEVLVHQARLSDMIIVARPRRSRSRVRLSPAGETLQAVMLGCGRPIMLVPPKWKSKRIEHAAIGWNDSLEASRALAMMMSCLPLMKAVTVVTSKKRKASASVLLEYLAWHDIDAQVEWLRKKDMSVGEAILKVCSTVGAELLVVGGFSHARARELLFGGVTRYLLANSKIVTVMVH